VISYNPKDWFTFLFRFHKSDTFRELLPMIISLCIYSGIIAWFYTGYLHMYENAHLKNISIMHTMLSFVISMMLVFRTNSAYDRWWEGRKLWGSLINNSRNLALKLNGMLPANAVIERDFFAVMISNYALALKNHLRTAFHPGEFHQHIWFDIKSLKQDNHQPNFVAREIFNKVHQLHRDGLINNEQLLYVNAELSSFTDICGACERIKNTPIPFSYSIFLKKFIFFFVMTLPFTMVFSLGYYCIPVVAFVFYALTSLELIAEEIEDPFGKDDNDLPTDAISKNIHKSVVEIFGFGS
jgi:putative membrane protein